MTSQFKLAAISGSALLWGTASAATLSVPGGTIFTTEAEYLAALASVDSAGVVTEDFDDETPGVVASGTTFSSGITLDLVPEGGSLDTEIVGGILELSIEDDSSTAPGSQVTTATLIFPVPTIAVSLEFVQGIGNDTGTFISIGGLQDFDPDVISGESDANDPDEDGYVGFFGFIADSAFTSLVFSQANENDDANDDDFSIDNIAAVQAVPVPGAAPLLLAGLAGFAALRRQRR